MESGDGVRDVYLREYYTCMHVFHYIIIYKIILAYIVWTAQTERQSGLLTHRNALSTLYMGVFMRVCCASCVGY